MATFVTHKINGITLQTTERYTSLQARDVGAFGVIWYVYPLLVYIRTVIPLTGRISSAHDSMANRTVAIKKIWNPFDSPARVKRTYREIHLMNHLRHDNVCAKESKYELTTNCQ